MNTDASIITVDGKESLGWNLLRAIAYKCVFGNERCVKETPTDAYLIKFQTSTVPIRLACDDRDHGVRQWTAGTMALLPFGTITRWHWDAPVESLVFEVRLELWNKVAGELFGRDGVQSCLVPKFFPEDEPLRQILRLLAQEFYSANPNGSLYVEGLSTALVAHLLRHHASTPMPGKKPRGMFLPAWRLQRICAYIDEHLDERIRLSDLACAAGVSLASLTLTFRSATGASPYQYVLCRRIKRAMEMISVSDLDLGEIAVRTGFTSQSHLTTAFRKATHITPLAFRKAQRNRIVLNKIIEG